MTKREDILEFFSEENIELFAEEVDGALMGYVERAGCASYILYDKEGLLQFFKPKPLSVKEYCLLFTKATLEEIENLEEDLLIADGFDEAIIGYAETSELNKFVIYNTEMCIDILIRQFTEDVKMENPKMTDEQIYEEVETMANEYFYYNTAGAYVGEKTPGFATIYL